MDVSTLLGTTLRQTPADAAPVGHQLLLRAGYVRQLGSGLFSLLPLAWRAMRRVEQLLREEVQAIGGQELSLPVVHPAEVWRASGRWDAVGSELLRFADRRGVEHCLAMTHEEVVAKLVSSEVSSWRQLPQLVFQIQTKFRDEPRARGGLIRVREFVMKDSYSLDRDVQGLHRQYEAHRRAYLRIFERCALPVVVVASDTGMMGGDEAHEFMFVSDVGEDRLALCEASGYAANLEVARFRKEVVDHGPVRPLRKVATPGARTIAQVSEQLSVPAHQLAKHVLYTGVRADGTEVLVVAVVRGDMDANPVAVRQLAGVVELEAAEPAAIRAAALLPGFASAVGLSATQRSALVVVADELIAACTNWVVGANEPDHHLMDAQLGRDFTADVVGPVALAYDGALDEASGQPLRVVRGVEVANIFQLGTTYTDAFGASFLDEQGVARPVVMGSYGIGLGRMLACIAEHHRDERGLAWPVTVAPFPVQLVALGRSAARDHARTLAEELRAAGVGVLLDDRDVGAGVKLTDADLRGLPLRVVVGDRGLARGVVELRRRLRTWRHEGPGTTEEGQTVEVPVVQAVPAIEREVAALFAEIEGA